MQQTEPLIRTKLHPPPARAGLVERPHLVARVREGLRGPLTLMVAPAGFGKSTLAAAAMVQAGPAVAWLSLERQDNESRRFLRYLTAALHQADPVAAAEAVRMLTADPQAPWQAVLTAILNRLEDGDREMALILDDYQWMTDMAVHEQVAFLLDHCPPSLHLVIATRSDPPLPLARLRARGQLVELRAADLAFSQAETARFLAQTMGIHMDRPEIDRLNQRTEGWIAGLQLAALSLRKCDDVPDFVARFSGTNRHILDYLLDEVLAREPEPVRAFLRRTSILSRLTGPLCNAVTGRTDGAEMLQHLEARNLFLIPLDHERRWYRYHHLFADLMQAQLHQVEPDGTFARYARAAAWCEAQGHMADAIRYALAARDVRHAADMVTQSWSDMALRGEVETVASWLDALPDAVVQSSAPLSVAACWVHWLTGAFGALEEHLAHAERAMADQSTPRPAELPAQIAALRAFVARYHGEFARACALAEEALRLIPAGPAPHTAAQLRSLASLALASAHDGAGHLTQAAHAYAETVRWSRAGGNAAGVAGITFRLGGILRLLGRLDAAQAACRDALAHMDAQGLARLPAAGILHVAMAEVLVEHDELDAAEAHLAQALELGRWSGRLDAVVNAAAARSRLHLARQDPDGALAAVDAALAGLSESPSPLAQAELLAHKARVLIRTGAEDDAARCTVEAERLAGWDRGLTGATVALARVRVQLARERPAVAVATLNRAMEAAAQSGRMGQVLELTLLRGLALAAQGESHEAETALGQALALAAPEGYVRLFVDEGRPMQELLAQWFARAGDGPQAVYAARLLTHFPTPPAAGATARDTVDPPVEPLSPRELEVLRIMATGKSNRQIAQQLIIAPGTVKAHTAAIYRKLDVANRTQAVTRARQLGILT